MPCRACCAAGELSPTLAWFLCAALALGGLAIVSTQFGALITKLYCFGLFLGTIYSVPPLRLKRFAVPAFLIIATVRGFLLNFGVYHAVRAALGLPFVWSPIITCVYPSACICCYISELAKIACANHTRGATLSAGTLQLPVCACYEPVQSASICYELPVMACL